MVKTRGQKAFSAKRAENAKNKSADYAEGTAEGRRQKAEGGRQRQLPPATAYRSPMTDPWLEPVPLR